MFALRFFSPLNRVFFIFFSLQYFLLTIFTPLMNEYWKFLVYRNSLNINFSFIFLIHPEVKDIFFQFRVFQPIFTQFLLPRYK